jgi:fatty-acyl-CoA synthase
MLPTIADLIRARADDDHPALLFEDQRYSYREYVQGCSERAALLLAIRQPGPFHLGVLLDNVPDYPMLLGAAALAGATLAGLNPTRRGLEMQRDIRHTDCQILITESKYRPMLDDLDLGVPDERIFDVDSSAWQEALAPHRGAVLPEVDLDPTAPYLLLFTSGTTGDPKAAICSQARLAGIGKVLGEMRGLTRDDTSYMVMPMFHSNALMAGWAPTLAMGLCGALRRKFSASGFLPDIRKFGATFVNYVGKPLTYVLATPEQPDDSDNTLRVAFGNEGAEHDLERFSKRFGCEVIDSYGSTEGGISISRTPDTPTGALGVGAPGTRIIDPETGKDCPPAIFDSTGRLSNADDAVGEIINDQSAATFEGYWNNEEANEERTHGGIYWSGDLGYCDDAGFIYFAGRNFDWLRVDGENFAAAPIERILVRHPDVSLACVYAVPNSNVGDDAMAALILHPGASFDPVGFASFLAEQSDLGTKWAPRYIRIAETLPQTETNKILKRELRRQRWECDGVWLRGSDDTYRPVHADDITRIRKEFEARNRVAALDA